MKITLCSAFRNSTDYLGRYVLQVEALRQALTTRGDTLYLVFGEGDSTDGTLRLLGILSEGMEGVLVDCSHGGPDFGSVEHPERFKQLAHVGNKIWAAIPDDTDVVLWVESDLVWQAETMLKLIDRVDQYTAISPMVYLRREGYPESTWYDTWAARKDGARFKHLPPYHTCYNAATPFLVDSMGSAMAIRGDIARRIVWDERVFVGACEQVYSLGGSVWIDPALSVIHN